MPAIVAAPSALGVPGAAVDLTVGNDAPATDMVPPWTPFFPSFRSRATSASVRVWPVPATTTGVEDGAGVATAAAAANRIAGSNMSVTSDRQYRARKRLCQI